MRTHTTTPALPPVDGAQEARYRVLRKSLSASLSGKPKEKPKLKQPLTLQQPVRSRLTAQVGLMMRELSTPGPTPLTVSIVWQGNVKDPHVPRGTSTFVLRKTSTKRSSQEE